MIREYKKLRGIFRKRKKRAVKWLKRKFPKLAYMRKCACAKWYASFGSVQEKMFVFKAYNGQAYDGMPRQIYETIRRDPVYADYKFAWLFEKKGEYKFLNQNERTRVYAMGSKKGMRITGRAHYYITNGELSFYQQFRKTQVVVCALEELCEKEELGLMARILQRANYVFVPKQVQQSEVDSCCRAYGNRKVAIVTEPIEWIPSTFINQKPGSADGKLKQKLRQHTQLFKCLKRINLVRYKVRADKKEIVRNAKQWIKDTDLYFLRLYYTMTGKLHKHGIIIGRNAKNLHAFREKYRGKRCFLIGNGPSLTKEDLEKLEGEITFGCNRVYQLYETTRWRPTFFCMIDALIAKYSSQELAEAVDCPLFTNINTMDLMKVRPQNVVFARNLGEPIYRVSSDFESYYVPSGATVMTFMLELAMYMGFREIYLLGVDCTSSLSEKGHCTAEYANKELIEKDIERIRKRLQVPTLTVEQVAAYYYDKSTAAYKIIEKYARERGIHIYNATRGGKLEVYKRRNLEQILEKK